MKTLSLLDIVFVLIPIIMFAIHLKWGPKMKFFAYGDGIDPGLILIFLFYMGGLGCLFICKQLAYAVLLTSCLVRPLLNILFEIWAKPAPRLHRTYHGPFPEK
jgi:hypothetical protein